MARLEASPLVDPPPPQCVADWALQLVDLLDADPDCAPEVRRTLRQQLVDLQAAAPEASPVDPTAPQIVRTPEALRTVADILAQAPVVAVDLETTGLDHRRGDLVGIGLACAAGVYYVPMAHRHASTGQRLPDQLAAAEVLRDLHLETLPLVAHNAKFEYHWLRHQAGIQARFVWDTMLAAHLLHSDRPVALKDVARRELDVPD
ncbi:MAG: hypothetical protein JNM56_06025 [Planctomycetia bacterium]|nr:hypothetical protein [Planctomycetia bacterium]